MKRTKKVLLTAAIVFSFFVINKVVAQALGFDILQLAQEKALKIVGINTDTAANELKQTKDETIDSTLTYVDQYVTELKQNLDTYSEQETESAKEKLKEKGQKIKETLEANKQQILDSSKAKIKIIIDQELSKNEEDLDGQLSLKIVEKLN
ncbi:MAG: hypothetical protein N2645_19445 [Clostridia bacterium]|nr:hypothetical protein [Clostridia bacterium]